MIAVRLPRQLRVAIETESKRRSKKSGLRVKSSDLIRVALAKEFLKKTTAETEP